LLKLSFVKKGLFIASESVEQQPLESIVSAQKSTNFLADNAKFQMQSAKIKVNVQRMAFLGA
jgi:hypothetical protein